MIRRLALALVLVGMLTAPAAAQSWVYSAAAERALTALLLQPGSCCVLTTIYGVGGTPAWTFPTADGTAGQTLITNGSGVLSFATPTVVAPINATYVTLSTNATLTAERVLTGTASQITITDNGAGSTVVLSLPATINVNTSGLAATATALATTRAINGVNFNGTADITVTAAAGTLSGATLAANVLASSLTSVGTLASLTVTAGAVAGTLTTTGHIHSSTTAPAVSNTSANSCGTTAAAIVGTDIAGKVTVGATAGTSCTVTFTTTWTNAPACVVTNETTANLLRATSSTTTVILAGTMVAGDVLAYMCLGRV